MFFRDFVFSTSIVDGSSIQFDLDAPIAYTATFTSKDFPNKPNYFVSPVLKNRDGVVVGANTKEEIAVGFADAISKDINISRYYFIEVNGDTVSLTAKQATARMTLDTNVTVGVGITMNTIQDGTDQYEGSIISDYSLYTDVYVCDGVFYYCEFLSSCYFDYCSTL